MEIRRTNGRFPKEGEFVVKAGYYYTPCPCCNELLTIPQNTAILREDGRLTVRSEVVCQNMGCPFHGWIEDGQIMEA